MKKIGFFLAALTAVVFFSLAWGYKTAEAEKVTAGWASQTKYRYATTNVQKSVVNAATGQIGKSSGSSVMAPSGAPWLTDCASGDGQRIRNAINVYAAWYNANVPSSQRCSTPNVPSTIRTQMLGKLKGATGCSTSCSCSTCCYNDTSKGLMVNKIMAIYNQKACQTPNSTIATPSTDQQTLTFMGIRKQCLEWAATIGYNAGGGYRGYSATGVSPASNYRPGMALYKTDRSHAMIITDIYWDASGNPTKFRIAESNYGTGWQNPCGQIPWDRKIGSRELSSISGCKVVNFE